MSRSFHLCLDVRGALQNWTDRQFKGVFLHDDGRPMSVCEAKNALMDEIAKGRKVIPCAPCDNFDYQHGCQGHEEPASAHEAGAEEQSSPEAKQESGEAQRG